MTVPPVDRATPDPVRAADNATHTWAPPGPLAGRSPHPGYSPLPTYAPPPGYTQAQGYGSASLPGYGALPENPPLPRTLARVAVGIGAVGLAISWVPILTWFGAILLIPALVLAIVALASPRQGGTARAAVALAMALVGLMMSLVMTVPSIYFLTGGFSGPSAGYEGDDITTQNDLADEPPPAQALVITEVAFGRTEGTDGVPGEWWYAAVIENPNEDWIYSDTFAIEAIAADGTVLSTDHPTQMLLHDTSAIAGSFDVAGGQVVDRIEVTLPDTGGAILSPRSETGSFRIEGVAAERDGRATTVTGTVRGDFADEYRRVPLVAVVRDDSGEMIGAARFELGLLPADGAPKSFMIRMPGVFPDGVNYEVYASL